MAKGDELEERLIDFAARVLKLCAALPRTQAGHHVAGQLLRSGTSPAANYAEARAAESRKDFVHKLKIALKEMNETHTWLRILTRSDMVPEQKLTDLSAECVALCKILNASITTTTANKRRRTH